MTSTVIGPFMKNTDLSEYTANLTRILHEGAVEHVRTIAEVALNLLTNPDSAPFILRSV